MGVAASEAIGIATEALGNTVKALQGITGTPGISDPNFVPKGTPIGPAGISDPDFVPRGTPIAGGGAGLVDPTLTATPLGSKNSATVQIINPSAGVDVVALTRVVIGEMNRQAGLRGLTGGR
jgi:hypothetical protein